MGTTVASIKHFIADVAPFFYCRIDNIIIEFNIYKKIFNYTDRIQRVEVFIK